MSSKIIDIEDELKTFLSGTLGFVEDIFLQHIPVDELGRLIMIRRENTLSLTQDLPIDISRVQIIVQDPHPHDSFLLAKEITDKLHGITPQALGVHKLLVASLDTGPDRADQEELELPRHFMFWVFRVRIQD